MAGIGRVWMMMAVTLALLFGGVGALSAHPAHAAMDQADHHHNNKPHRDHATLVAAPCCPSIEAPARVAVSRTGMATRLPWLVPANESVDTRAPAPDTPPPKTIL